jgi:hypothetical protein
MALMALLQKIRKQIKLAPMNNPALRMASTAGFHSGGSNATGKRTKEFSPLQSA